MATMLPDDVLYLICEQLAFQRQFDTLFSCIGTGKRLAVPALTHLYRNYHESPLIREGTENLPLAQQELLVQKWSILWRSIILSSMGQTIFPYSRYLKLLDLRDLHLLFEDDKFRGKISKNFFSGDLARFNIPQDTPTKFRSARGPRLNVVAAINTIGEVITQDAPMLEQITGEVLASSLVAWAPRLSNLRSLWIWDGKALADDAVQTLIHTHCHKFDALTVFSWKTEDADHKLSTFISGFRENLLRLFQTISDAGVGAETLLALNNHGSSLKELKLGLKADFLPQLAFLKGCVNLEVFSLTVYGVNSYIEKTDNESFEEIIAWLRECKDLRELKFDNFNSGATLLTTLLIDDNIRLHKLDLNSYEGRNHRAFHVALQNQATLRSLLLQGDSEDMVGDEIEILLDSVTSLTGLRELNLGRMSDFFNDMHITRLATHLTNLEELVVSGWNVTDRVLHQVSTLKNLRSVTFEGLSAFSAKGLHGFIRSLSPSNRGLAIAVQAADQDRDFLTDEEQAIIREEIAAKVGGSFDYIFFRVIQIDAP
ncbi:hypothetical protein M501DRAFT_989318 [Patellaria atrata CBS 101060]|uniref:Uncharacterized protein n=1 Tax=Patellaria atrata CBS 101060 TaxID=1346257 RepID=A0A9P4S231_9PEZI|nr:hypothetical protein M501DRAFT_989318 [Patellaria atrata CBS 101060]